jgi:hypothetical protein
MKKYRESKQHHVVDRRDIGDNMFLLILIVNKEALELKFSNPTSQKTNVDRRIDFQKLHSI